MRPTEMEKFHVIAVSTDRNSFGLRGHMVVNERGHVYEIGLNHLRERKVGSVIRVPLDYEGRPLWCKVGAEIPTLKPDMPMDILNRFLSYQQSTQTGGQTNVQQCNVPEDAGADARSD